MDLEQRWKRNMKQKDTLSGQRHTWRFYTHGEFDRQRKSQAIDADTPGDFFADRGDMAVLKTRMIKPPNLMGWLYWRFTAINVENRGNGHTWRMSANLIADIWHARYRRFYTPVAAIGENRNRCTGHIKYNKIAKCVAGFSLHDENSIKQSRIYIASWLIRVCQCVSWVCVKIILYEESEIDKYL